jgi:GAF domain-containing protein
MPGLREMLWADYELHRQPGEEEALRAVLQLTLRVLGADEGSVAKFVPGGMEDGTDALVFVLTVGDPESQRLLAGRRVPVTQSLMGQALFSRMVEMGPTRWDGVPQASGRQPAMVLAAPLQFGDTLLGAVTAVRLEGQTPFGAREAEILAQASDMVGTLLDQHLRLKALEAGLDPEAGSLGRELLPRLQRLGRRAPAVQAQLLDLIRTLDRQFGATE